MADNQTLVLDGFVDGLYRVRSSWWPHWAELAIYIFPRRMRWLVTANQSRQAQASNAAIIDSTGTIAARTLASGMMSGITSPTRPWFKLRVAGYGADEVNPVNIWLADCERRMLHVFQESNFYNAMGTMYLDLGVFGNGPVIIYEDHENVIYCVNPCAGEYMLWNLPNGMPGGLAREFTYTVAQMVKEFGIDNCSTNVQNLFRRNDKSSLQQEVVIRHVIQPNDDNWMPARWEWWEAYWEKGTTEAKLLRKRGFYEQPFIAPRWATTGNDAYGSSVAMDALGDIKQLQQETRRKAQAIDKLANPPMVADVELKNAPASTLPGGVTYVTKKEGVGFKPAYENFRPPINELMQDIALVQQRIKDVFFNDLFMMISSLQTVRTATEIDARREEKLVMLGPVLERLQTEGQDPIIDRVFGVMLRRGLFLDPPPEIAQIPISVEYVSMLAEAQRAANTTGMERFMAQLGNVGAIRPEVLDIPNWDRMLTRYGMVLGNDPSDINTAEELAAIRDARAKQQQAQQAVEVGTAAVQGAKTLSETDVGGGQSALQSVLYGPGSAGAYP